MAYNYDEIKRSYEAMSPDKQKEFSNMASSDKSGNIQKFLNQYNQEKATPAQNNTQTNNNVAVPEFQGTGADTKKQSTYNNQGNGNYSYSSETGYYEKEGESAKPVSSGTTTGTDTMSKLRQEWDSWDYATQQQKLKENPELKANLAKYGFVEKAKPVEQGGTTTGEKPHGGAEWDYQDNSQQRLDEIVNNLNNYRNTNPEFFDSWESFYNFFIKGKNRSDDQLLVLESYFDATQKYSKYDNMTASGVGYALAHGNCPQEYLSYLKTTNPERYAQVMDEKAKAENQISNENNYSSLLEQNGFENTYPKQVDYAREIGFLVDKNEDWVDDKLYPEPSAEEQKNVSRINEIIAERMDIANQRKNLEEEMTKQYPGVPRATIMGIVNDRLNTLNKRDDELAVELAQLQGQVSYQQNERKLEADARQKTINNLQTAYGLYYGYSAEGMSELSQAQYSASNITLEEAENGTTAQKEMALDNVLTGYYERYGTIIQRSKEQVINDVLKTAREKGMTLSEALEDNFLSYLRKKPEFATISSGREIGSGSSSSSGVKWTEMKDGNGNLYLYDQSTGNIKYVGKDGEDVGVEESTGTVTNDYGKKYTPVSSGRLEYGLQDYVSDIETGDYGGQCGAFVNKGLKAMGVITENLYDDSISSKLLSINEGMDVTPETGWVAVWNPDKLEGDGKKYGHVGFVLQDNGDGTIKVIDSNGRKDGKVWVRDVWKSNLSGYFNPSQKANSSDEIMTEYGVPLTFHNAIWGDIPTKEKDNVNEKEDIQKRIKALYEAGLDAVTASVVYKGWTVNPGTEPELSDKLLTIMLSMSELPQTYQFRNIANFINKGQSDVAIRMVEDIVNNQAKDTPGYVSELSVRNIMNQAGSLKDYVKKLREDRSNPIGNITGTVQDWLGRFKGNEAATIEAYINNMMAYMTETMGLSQDMAKSIVPQLGDSTTNFVTKLNSLKGAQLSLLNNRRRMYFLPILAAEEVGRPETRYDAYVRNNVTTSSKTTGTSLRSLLNL